jgi:hypothetical protein
VLIACALGRATFQSGSSAWTPLGAVAIPREFKAAAIWRSDFAPAD